MTAAWQPCRVCGKAWRPWAGSQLDCHAACHFSPARQVAILARAEQTPGLTQRAHAAELGVSIAVYRATLRAALKRKAGK